MASDGTGAARWWTLAGFCSVLFASVAFKSMVGIAIPDLQRDLGADLGQLQWVLNAYTLMLAALLVSAGAAADRYGRRRAYVAGLAVFALGALACLSSPTATVLDLSSALMGLGGGVIFAAGAGLVSVRFSGTDRAAAFAAVAAASAGAAAVGPLLAGVLIDALGWRGVFGFLALLGAAALATEVLKGSEAKVVPDDERPLDWLGPLAFGAALFALVFALTRGNDEGFGSPLIVGCIVAGVALLGVFAVTQAVRGRPGSRAQPMLDPGVLRRPSVAGAAIAHFALGFVAFGLSFYLAIHLGRVLANSPTDTALKLLPLTAVAFAAAPAGSWLMRHVPPRTLVPLCLLLMAAGSWLLRAVGPGSEWTALIPGFVVIGLGSGAIVPVVVSTAVSVVPQSRAAVAAAINNAARQVGIAFGVAGLGAYFQARVAARLDGIDGVDPDALAEAVVAGGVTTAADGVPAAVRETVEAASPAAFFGGLDELFLVLAVVATLGALLSALLIRPGDFVIPVAGRASDPEPAPAN